MTKPAETPAPVVPDLLRKPLAGSIDYAGLFPPAALSMGDVVANYHQYRGSDDAWALGRLIVPATRLDEWLAAVDESTIQPDGWQLSITLGADLATELATATRAVPQLARRGAIIGSFEGRVTSRADLKTLAEGAGSARWYAEVAPGPTVEDLLDAITGSRGRAKIRTGGVTPEAFLPPAVLAGLILAITTRKLAFKATAGLHHPVRGEFALTYAANAPRGTMFGYLNLLAATALAETGRAAAEVEAALTTTDPADLLRDGQLAWRGRLLAPDLIDRLDAAFDGFGSCSFREPIDELLTAMTR